MSETTLETISVLFTFMYGATGILCFLMAFYGRFIAKWELGDGRGFVTELCIANVIFIVLKIELDERSRIEIPAAFNFYAAMTGVTLGFVLAGIYWIANGNRRKK